MKLPKRVRILEVGPRDGLQNVAAPVSTDDKVRLIDALSETGVPAIEATSFVHPKLVPQMADAEEIMRRITRRPEVRYSALVPNEKGARRAIESEVDIINCFVSASESHSQSNSRMSITEALRGVTRVVALAREADIPVHTDISTSFGCPFEGRVPPAKVIEIGRFLRDAGVQRVALADTTGMANPLQVDHLLRYFLREVPDVELAVHFHDTRGAGLANVLAALQVGVRALATSVGGMGGCPFAPGATGNVCSEDVVHMLEEMGVDTGINLQKLIGAAELAQQIVGAELPSHLLKAGPASWLPDRARADLASPSASRA